MRPEIVLAAVLAIVLFSVGDTLAAAWGKTGRWWWFAGMFVAGNLAWVLFALLNKSLPLAVVSGIVNVGLALVSILAGWLIFGEKLLPLEKVAIAVGIVSLVLFAAARATAPAEGEEPPAIQENAAH